MSEDSRQSVPRSAWLDGEEVFVPLSVPQGPLSPPYSPYPLNDVDSGSACSSAIVSVRPLIITGTTHSVTNLVKKKREKKRKLQRQQRLLRKNKSLTMMDASSASSIVREGKRTYSHTFDPYYHLRFSSFAEVDPVCLEIAECCSVPGKRVLDVCGGGNAWIAFFLAARGGADHVVSIHPDLETTLRNCKQLRKLKHDGVPTTADKSEDYPKYLLRRMGPVSVVNKPWLLVGAACVGAASKFPFNLEFRCADFTKGPVPEEKFDVVIACHLPRLEDNEAQEFAKAILAVTSAGAFNVSEKRQTVLCNFFSQKCQLVKPHSSDSVLVFRRS